MKILKIPFVIIMTCFLFSCLVKDKAVNQSLIGIWVFKNYKKGETSFKKRRKFCKNKPGIEFKENGKLIKRQNIGWCGTPPITYENVEGTWKMSSDSIITIKYEYWGGESKKNWKINKVSYLNLRVDVE